MISEVRKIKEKIEIVCNNKKLDGENETIELANAFNRLNTLMKY